MSISPLDRRARAGRESIASAAQCRTRRSAAEHTEPGVNMAWGAIVRAPVGGGVMDPGAPGVAPSASAPARSEEHTSALQSLMRLLYAVLCLKKQKTYTLPKQSKIITQ